MNRFGFLIAVLAITLISCTNQSKRADTTLQDSYPLDATIDDIHTSETSLDWAGVYKGVLPCAGCEGIETVIELNDDLTYQAQYTYLGKPEAENAFVSKGPFTWNDDGSSISLQAESEPTQYKVGENYLTLLNADGDINTGELADLYVLKKKM